MCTIDSKIMEQSTLTKQKTPSQRGSPSPLKDRIPEKPLKDFFKVSNSTVTRVSITDNVFKQKKQAKQHWQLLQDKEEQNHKINPHTNIWTLLCQIKVISTPKNVAILMTYDPTLKMNQCADALVPFLFFGRTYLLGYGLFDISEYSQ